MCDARDDAQRREGIRRARKKKKRRTRTSEETFSRTDAFFCRRGEMRCGAANPEGFSSFIARVSNRQVKRRLSSFFSCKKKRRDSENSVRTTMPSNVQCRRSAPPGDAWRRLTSFMPLSLVLFLSLFPDGQIMTATTMRHHTTTHSRNGMDDAAPKGKIDIPLYKVVQLCVCVCVDLLTHERDLSWQHTSLTRHLY